MVSDDREASLRELGQEVARAGRPAWRVSGQEGGREARSGEKILFESAVTY
jgi:hypothetical protein